jgi:hypothetical protein
MYNCGIIASVELFLGIQNMMEKELVTSKEFYILSSDIFKTLSVERQYRTVDGKIYLDNIHTKYCNLIEQSNLLNNKIENLQINDIISTNINHIEDKNSRQEEEKTAKDYIKDQKQKEENTKKIKKYEFPNIEYENL